MASKLIQGLWFRGLRRYVHTGLHFFYRRIEVHGKENIPEGGVIFTPNHQNALADALLLICHTSQPVHSLARASIFKQPAVAWLLGTFNMMPVFRVRDGMSSITNNNDIFAKCCQLIATGGALLIFPEGDHNMKRRVPPLSKGFTRIAFGAAQLRPSVPIHVVPVSINYSQHERSGSVVSLYYGKPINVAAYLPNDDAEEHSKALLLRQAVSDGIAAQLVQVPEPYDENVDRLKKQLGDNIVNPRAVEDYFNPQKFNQATTKNVKPVWRKALANMGLLINVIPIMVLRMLVKRLTKQTIFYATLKIGLGIFLFPAVYWLEWWLLDGMIDEGAIWLWPISIVGVLAYTKG